MGLAHRGFDWELTPDAPHAAAIFAGLGFEPHLSGAQHVTQHPERLGFGQMHPTEAVEQILASKPRERRLYLEINFDETHRPYPPPGPIPRDLVIPGYLPAGREAAEEMTAVEGAITRMDAPARRAFPPLHTTPPAHPPP